MPMVPENVLRVVTSVVGWCDEAIRELENATPRPEALISQLARTREEAMDTAVALGPTRTP
jgi:hypothetical protein